MRTQKQGDRKSFVLGHPVFIFKKYCILARKSKPSVDPEYLQKQREALRRRNRQVIYLNDSEMAAIELYCDKFHVTTKSVLFRQAIMEKVLSELDDSHPTLF